MTRRNHSIATGVAILLGLILLGVPVQTASAGAIPTGRLFYSFGGQMPPPAYTLPFIHDFIPVFGGYLALPEDSERFAKPDFVQWCIICGIDCPRKLQIMHVLHLWAERVGFDPRRVRIPSVAV